MPTKGHATSLDLRGDPGVCRWASLGYHPPVMPWSRQPDQAQPGVEPGAIPSRSGKGGPGLVSEILDPVLVPLGFAPGQVGGVGDRGGVTFCRGEFARISSLTSKRRPTGRSSTFGTGAFRATDGTSTSTEAPALLISWPTWLRPFRASWGKGGPGRLPGAMYAADPLDLPW